MADHYPFRLRPLPYSYDALEPYISAEILRLHHGRHLAGYVEKLNAALAPCPDYQGCTLPQLLAPGRSLPRALQAPVCRNGGGVFSHDLYFDCMGPGGGGEAVDELGGAIRRGFGGFAQFREQLARAALSRFGSGWAWLVSDVTGRLKILSTANQELPLPLCPILALDVWEHAYYPQYRNLRAEYVENWFHTVNWPLANRRYLTSLCRPIRF